MSETAQPGPRATLQCKPEKVGDQLVFPYTIVNDGPGDIFVSDAFHRVDPSTHIPSADRELVAIALQPDGYVLILRGVPPLPMNPVTRRVFPLVHRLRAGERMDRRLAVPLPLAEASPYQPYSNVRDYVLKPIEGVTLAIDWIAAGAEGLVATPAAGAEDLFSLYAPALAQSMTRLACRYPTKGLSVLHRVRN